MQPCPQTAPSPILGALNQASCQRITLDVTQQRQQMFVFFDRKTLEPPLIQRPVSDCPMRHAPTHRVRECHPAKELADLPIRFRRDDEMPVVSQHAIREDRQIESFMRRPQDGVLKAWAAGRSVLQPPRSGAGKPSSMARTAAWVRSETSSLRMMRSTWTLAVP